MSTIINAPITLGGSGRSAYQSYLATTQDTPPLTEAEWSTPLNESVFAIIAISSSVALDPIFSTVLADDTAGAIVVTLPPASGNQKLKINIKKTAFGNGVTVITPDSATIDGLDSLLIDVAYDCYNLLCDGTNWHIF